MIKDTRDATYAATDAATRDAATRDAIYDAVRIILEAIEGYDD